MPQSQELAGKTHQTTIVVLQMGNMQANLEQLLQHNLRTPKTNQKTTNQFVCNLQPTSKTLSFIMMGFLINCHQSNPTALKILSSTNYLLAKDSQL
jgi:hypothetical protein